MSGSELVSRRGLTILAVVVIAAALAGCVPYELKQILDGPKGKALSISPSSTVVPALGTVDFSADGGVPPYVFSITSGGGVLNATTGAYTAPPVVGTAVIRVTDKTGKGANASVAIQVLVSALAISPGALTMAVGSNVTFSPIGGTPPYGFAMQTSGSGTPSVNGAGLYVTGSSPGIDVVRLTDSLAATVTATITVTAVTSSVDYTVPATNFVPPIGTVSTAMPGGYSFTLQNSGSGNGSQTVDWKVYLSANAVLDGGDLLVASGTHAPLAAGANAPVAVAGTFPAVPPGVWRLIAQVSAADDTTPANNTSGASVVTLSPQDIDYTVPAVSNTGATIAGAAMDGTFTIQNTGGAAGSALVNWDVYASADTILDGADYLLARGSHAALGAGATSAGIPVSGYWPSTPGTWYILATVSATDDIGPGNNTTASLPVTTTGPAAPNVDVTVPSVNNTGGTTAGDPLSGSFTIHNGGTDPGAQPIAWTAYLSSNATLEVGTDPVIDSGVHAALAAGATSAPVSFAGTWPSGAGAWRLIVAISASDDIAPGNNVTVGGPFATTAPNIDYRVFSVICTGGTTAGAALAGEIVVQNVGPHAGSQFVPWAVYLSADGALNIGTDQLLATGAIAAPGLGAGASSASLPFAGTWPQSTSPQTWHLIATVGAGDDVNPGNNVTDSGGIGVNPLNIDYTVTIVTNTGGTTAGGALTGSFTVHNNGADAGSSPVNWTAYLSPNATLDITDQVITTGSTGALPAFGTSGGIPFAGTWPAGTATWYLIVKISAADDISAANDVTASAAVPVTALTPVYTITAVPLPAGSTAGQAVSGTFTIQNGPAAAGSAAINWQVYASLGDAIYNAGDVLLQSGSIGGGLPASGSSSPGYASTWPLTPGTWYIVVHATAGDAPAIADAASGAVAVTSPAPPDYAVSFNPATPWSGVLSTAMSATGTCQITIQNITGNAGESNITWSVYLSTDNVLDGGDTLVQQATIGPLGAGASTSPNFVGNWPGGQGKFYWLIASISAADDSNSANNVKVAHPSAIGDYRYQEGVEDNSGVGPNPPLAQTSNTAAPALGNNKVLVIEGVMDAFNQYDTYRFTTAGGVGKLNMRAAWATGFDDIDLYFWDTGATNLNSLETGIDWEPAGVTFDLTGISPAMYFISAKMWLDGGTSGSTGQKYVIWVKGRP